jgi:hypothetical protein
LKEELLDVKGGDSETWAIASLFERVVLDNDGSVKLSPEG